MIRIEQVDPRDEAALRAFWETEQAAMRADRSDPLLRPWPTLRNSMLEAGPYYRRTHWLALEGDRVVGGAELGGSVEDNRHVADLEVCVRPDARRRGVGRALHDEAVRWARDDGRSTVGGEVYVAALADDADSPAYAFATALGFGSVHREDHLVLRLPLDQEKLSALRGSVVDHASGYDVVTWGDRCPDEYVAGFCAMKTQMSNDVPTGEIDYEPIVYDEARLRSSEERTSRSYHQLVAAARRTDGTFGGYTQQYLPHGEPDVLQDDTLVMPEHRGHRLGTVLKLATLDLVLRDHADRTAVHTWTDPENQAMYRTNLGFGFEVAERMHEVQRKDG